MSIPAIVMAAAHGYQMGSDGTTFAFKAMLVVMTAVVAFPAGLRLMSVVTKRRTSG